MYKIEIDENSQKIDNKQHEKIHSNHNGQQPGQGSSLQLCSSTSIPSQSLPPWIGAGLSQLLLLVCDPVPQASEHEPHSSHSDQLPSPKMTRRVHLSSIILILKGCDVICGTF